MELVIHHKDDGPTNVGNPSDPDYLKDLLLRDESIEEVEYREADSDDVFRTTKRFFPSGGSMTYNKE